MVLVPAPLVALSMMPPRKPSPLTSIEPARFSVVFAWTATMPPVVPFQSGATSDAPDAIVSVSYCGTRTTCTPPALEYAWARPQESPMVFVPVFTLCTSTSSYAPALPSALT